MGQLSNTAFYDFSDVTQNTSAHRNNKLAV